GRTSIFTSGLAGITVNTGVGADTVTVANMGGTRSTIDASSGGGDSINVFNFQLGAVTVNDSSRTASLRVSDSFALSPSYTVASNALVLTSFGLNQRVNYSGLASVELDTGSGAVVSIDSTSIATKVTTGANSTIRMGNGPFAGPLSIVVFGGGGTLDYS